MKKKILILIVICISVRFFCGVYDHDEFAETHFFIKHRPIWKWKFHSPIGQSDLQFEELSNTDKIEQKYFNEFVLNQGLSR